MTPFLLKLKRISKIFFLNINLFMLKLIIQTQIVECKQFVEKKRIVFCFFFFSKKEMMSKYDKTEQDQQCENKNLIRNSDMKVISPPR